MKKRLMVIGAGVFQIPAIKKAKEMGLMVIATDMNPKAPGLELADIPVVASTMDIPSSIQVAKEHKVDGVMTMASDVPVETVAVVAESLGLPGIPLYVAKIVRDKLLTRKALKDKDVPIPSFRGVGNIEEAKEAALDIGFPVMVKVVDNSGSRGISKVENLEGINGAFELAMSNTRTDIFCVEEFIEGPEFGAETFTVNGNTEMIVITRKTMTPLPYFVPIGHTVPAQLPQELREDIYRVVRRGIQSLGIEIGPVNVDIRVTPEGPMILDVGARLGGTCLPEVVFQSSGIDTVKAAIDAALGNRPDLAVKFDIAAAARLITSERGGRVERIDISSEEYPEGIKEVAIDVGVGDIVKSFTCGADRIGHIIAVGKTPDEVSNLADKVRDMVRIDIAPTEYEINKKSKTRV